MMVGDYYTLLTQFEIMDVEVKNRQSLPIGMFNFIIDDVYYPARNDNVSLQAVFEALKGNLESGLLAVTRDFKTSYKRHNYATLLKEVHAGKSQEVMDLTKNSPLSERGFSCYLGFDGDEERLLYSNDHEKTFKEIRYDKGTVASVIRSLPDAMVLKSLVKSAPQTGIPRFYTKMAHGK